ncbi:MAG: hypothetical protein V4488_20135 [Pseudomonadota bacterium]
MEGSSHSADLEFTNKGDFRDVFTLAFSLLAHVVLIIAVGKTPVVETRRPVEPEHWLQVSLVNSNTVKTAVKAIPSAEVVRKKIPAPVGVELETEPALNMGERPAPLPFDIQAFYYHTEELTRAPVVQQDVQPAALASITNLFQSDFPEQALTLRLLINENGDIDKVELEEENLSERIKLLVQDAFLKLKFLPGAIGDLPVKSQMTIVISMEAIVQGTENHEMIELSHKIISVK